MHTQSRRNSSPLPSCPESFDDKENDGKNNKNNDEVTKPKTLSAFTAALARPPKSMLPIIPPSRPPPNPERKPLPCQGMMVALELAASFLVVELVASAWLLTPDRFVNLNQWKNHDFPYSSRHLPVREPKTPCL